MIWCYGRDRFQKPEIPKFPFYMREWNNSWYEIDSFSSHEFLHSDEFHSLGIPKFPFFLRNEVEIKHY